MNNPGPGGSANPNAGPFGFHGLGMIGPNSQLQAVEGVGTTSEQVLDVTGMKPAQRWTLHVVGVIRPVIVVVKQSQPNGVDFESTHIIGPDGKSEISCQGPAVIWASSVTSAASVRLWVSVNDTGPEASVFDEETSLAAGASDTPGAWADANVEYEGFAPAGKHRVDIFVDEGVSLDARLVNSGGTQKAAWPVSGHSSFVVPARYALEFRHPGGSGATPVGVVTTWSRGHS